MEKNRYLLIVIALLVAIIPATAQVNVRANSNGTLNSPSSFFTANSNSIRLATATKFIFIGDSTSADYFYGPQGNWPAMLMRYVSSRTSNADYLNLAVPGQRVFTIDQNFDTVVAPEIIAGKTVIVTLGGGNDFGFGTTPEQLVGYWQNIWTKSRNLGATVVALTFYPVTLPNTEWREDVDDLVIASSSYWDFLVNLTAADVALRDDQHETIAGHLTIAQSVADVIAPESSAFSGIITYPALEKSFSPYKLEVPIQLQTPNIIASDAGNVQLTLQSAGTGNIAITAGDGTRNIVLSGVTSVVGNFSVGGVTTLSTLYTGNVAVGGIMYSPDIRAAIVGNVDLALTGTGTGIVKSNSAIVGSASITAGTNQIVLDTTIANEPILKVGGATDNAVQIVRDSAGTRNAISSGNTGYSLTLIGGIYSGTSDSGASISLYGGTAGAGLSDTIIFGRDASDSAGPANEYLRITPSAITASVNIIPSTGIVGVTSVSNADAGDLGEIVTSAVPSGSAVSLTTATAANVTSISITAGDWDVTGNVNFSAATATSTGYAAGITVTSATVPTDGTEGYSGLNMTLLSSTDTITLPRKRINISTTTTVYLVGKATFSAGTVGGFGSITARRVR